MNTPSNVLWARRKALNIEYRSACSNGDEAAIQRLEHDLRSLDEDLETSLNNEVRSLPGTAGAAVEDLGFNPNTSRTATEFRALNDFVRSAKVGDSLPVELRSVLNIAGGTATGGDTVPTIPGALVTPAVWVGGIEPLARTLVTSDGSPMPIPVSNTRPAFSKVGEGAQIPESNGSLLTVTLTPGKFAAIAGATFEMLSDSVLDVASQIIVPGFRSSWRITAEDALLNGTEVTGNGILGETPKIVTTATNAVTGDDLIEATVLLNPVYLEGAVWVMSPATILAARTLKDSEGNYLLTGLSEGMPRLVGRPVLSCPQAPNMGADVTFAALVNPGEAITQRYVNGMTVERSDEWKWDEDIASFKGRVRYDAAVTNPDAIVTIANADA